MYMKKLDSDLSAKTLNTHQIVSSLYLLEKLLSTMRKQASLSGRKITSRGRLIVSRQLRSPLKKQCQHKWTPKIIYDKFIDDTLIHVYCNKCSITYDPKEIEMSSPSKRKGNTFEREVVTQAKEKGIKSIRAYASNGLSLGEAEDVDVKIGKFKGQCKRRKRIAVWLKPPESCDIAIVREDRGKTYVIIEYNDFLELIPKEKQ